MRNTLPRSLIAVGLVVAVFAFPSAAWADPGADTKEKKDQPVEQTEPDSGLPTQAGPGQGDPAHGGPGQGGPGQGGPGQEGSGQPGLGQEAPGQGIPDEVDPGPPDSVVEPGPETVPETPVEEPGTVDGTVPQDEPTESEAVEEQPVDGADEATEAEKAEAELEEGQSEILINPGNVNNGAGTKAADFGQPNCDHIPNGVAPEGQDGWVFVLPGNSGSFVSVSASFAEDGTIDGTVVTGYDGKFAYVLATAGWTLTGATAVIEGDTPQGQFNLTHACPGTGVPPPPVCDDGSQPPCEEPPPVCDDGSQPPCEEQPPPQCDDDGQPPCEEQPPPGDNGTPPVSTDHSTQPQLEKFVPQSSSGDSLPITGNPLGLTMLVGVVLLATGGLVLILYRVRNRTGKLGGDVDS